MCCAACRQRKQPRGAHRPVPCPHVPSTAAGTAPIRPSGLTRRADTSRCLIGSNPQPETNRSPPARDVSSGGCICKKNAEARLDRLRTNTSRDEWHQRITPRHLALARSPAVSPVNSSMTGCLPGSLHALSLPTITRNVTPATRRRPQSLAKAFQRRCNSFSTASAARGLLNR